MRTVTLGQTRFRVVVVKDALAHARRYDGPESEVAKAGVPVHGYISTRRKRIVIQQDRPEIMASTLLGEMLHSAFQYVDDFHIHRGEDLLFPTLWRLGFRPFGSE